MVYTVYLCNSLVISLVNSVPSHYCGCGDKLKPYPCMHIAVATWTFSHRTIHMYKRLIAEFFSVRLTIVCSVGISHAMYICICVCIYVCTYLCHTYEFNYTMLCFCYLPCHIALISNLLVSCWGSPMSRVTLNFSYTIQVQWVVCHICCHLGTSSVIPPVCPL